LSESRKHSVNLALRNRRIEKERFNRDTNAYLYTYEMNLCKLTDFNLKIFEDADLEWVQFVLSNRRTRERTHNYDVVMGLTADDNTMVVINAYLDGLYGVIGSETALNLLIKNIEAEKLPRQIYISNNNALKILSQTGQVEIV